jgi:tryptophanyl-tRNA synthetase
VHAFRSKRIDAELLARVEKLTVGRGRVPCLHPFLRRGIFFSHRDLSAICSAAEAAEAAAAAAGGSGSSASPPFYLYTGRGPSSAAMHLGHLVPFLMTQWLQKAFDVPLVIQMTDDEKFLWKGEYKDGEGDNLEHYHSLAVENAKDIIACGFDKSKTFIFSDLDYVGSMYPNIVRIWKAVTYSQAKGCFGFEGSSNIGQSAFPAIQAAPSFPSSFPVPLGNQNLLPCLIPCAIDQDPYFRITRDIAHKIVPTNHPLKGKPALLHSKFFPPLEGALGKMSSSNENSAVFLTDSPDAIAEKIKTHAFSGGQATKALQEEKGADLEVDVAYQWLSFFLDNDEELAAIGDSYSRGQGAYWSTGLVKDKLVDVLQKMVAVHQARRDTITNDEVLEWMATRPLV